MQTLYIAYYNVNDYNRINLLTSTIPWCSTRPRADNKKDTHLIIYDGDSFSAHLTFNYFFKGSTTIYAALKVSGLEYLGFTNPCLLGMRYTALEKLIPSMVNGELTKGTFNFKLTTLPNALAGITLA